MVDYCEDDDCQVCGKPKRLKPCPICTDRPDLAKGSLLYQANRDPEQHTLLQHTEFTQTAWELGIYREDNPDEWRELKRLTRIPGREL